MCINNYRYLKYCLIIASLSIGIQHYTRAEDFASPSQLECNVVNSRSLKVKGGDYDDKLEKFSMVVTVSNKNMSKAMPPLHATFYVFGECVNDRKKLKILQKEVFDLELEPRGKFTHTTPVLELKFDNTWDATFGEKYKGWVIQITDADGKQVFEQKNAAFLTDTKNLSSLKVNDFCDKTGKSVSPPPKVGKVR